MKTTLFTTLILLMFCPAIVFAGDKHATGGVEAWFDLENCDFCRHLTKDDKLLDNMNWEHHNISNGVLTITTVHPDHMSAYKTAQAGMMELGAALETGERKFSDIKMCGHCQHYGKLMESGVKVEYVNGQMAEVVLMTSTNPATVKLIKGFGERNRDELAAWESSRNAQ